MKALSQTNQFAKDMKRMTRRGKDPAKMRHVVGLLARGRVLESKFRDHPLRGDWQGSRDCHLEPDWVLIYTTDPVELRLERTGSHADLFE
jgi:mRNA interferase YafQ